MWGQEMADADNDDGDGGDVDVDVDDSDPLQFWFLMILYDRLWHVCPW